MRFKIGLIVFAVTVLIQQECFGYAISSKEQLQQQAAKPARRTYIESLSDQIIDYFKLNEKDSFVKSLVPQSVKKTLDYIDRLLQRATQNEEACEQKNTDYFTKYFFDVYTETGETWIGDKRLKEMVKYHIERGPRSDEIEIKALDNKCKSDYCLVLNDIQKILNKTGKQINSNLTQNNFKDFCPFLLFNIELEHCKIKDEKPQLEKWEVWLYGMLLTAVVTIWSWSGAIVFPIITKKIYKRVLTFMISLAFGTLTSNGLLKYIPLADGFDENDYQETNYSFFYKHLVILVVIFFFFNFERSMKIFTIYRTKVTRRKKQKKIIQEKLNEIVRQESEISVISVNDDPNGGRGSGKKSRVNFSTTDDESGNLSESKNKKKQNNKRRYTRQQSINIGDITIFGPYKLDEITGEKMAKAIKQQNDDEEEETGHAAINAIFGDGLGNFIDGLSIGASINQNLAIGLTTAIATWFSNVPQELGDFALLVRSGMTPFQALCYNFLSAQSAFLGCTVGIVFGSQIEAARWIFAVSGATSLYLGLAVLLPELNEEFDDPKESFREKIKVTAIQLMGMIAGMSIMIILNMYDEDFEKNA